MDEIGEDRCKSGAAVTTVKVGSPVHSYGETHFWALKGANRKG